MFLKIHKLILYTKYYYHKKILPFYNFLIKNMPNEYIINLKNNLKYLK